MSAPLIAAGVGLGLIALQLGRSLASRLSGFSMLAGRGAFMTKDSASIRWVPVTIDGVEYLVSSTYLAPMGIGEAVQFAKDNGFILPTPRMVDAIWQAADLKVNPISSQAFGEENKGDNPSQFAKHAKAVEEQLAGQSFDLLAGTHKDVVFIDRVPWQAAPINKPGIYGWHYPNGKRIQQEMWGHALSWKDYSQGLRLVKRA